jgi:hypothetical protein
MADDTDDPADLFDNIYQPEKHPTIPNLHVVGMVDYEHKLKNLFELVSRHGFPGIPANAFWDMAEDPVMAGKFSTGWYGRDIHRVKQSYHMVALDVEEYFELKGNIEAALFCRVFRQLIRALDEKGNSQETRLDFFRQFQEYFDSKVCYWDVPNHLVPGILFGSSIGIFPTTSFVDSDEYGLKESPPSTPYSYGCC